MSNDLISLEVAGSNDDAILAVSKATTFLPRIQLYCAVSKMCQEQKIGIGHFGLIRSKDNLDDLGTEFDCIILAGRSKALRIDGGNIMTFYDYRSEEFGKVQAESQVRDSGCMFGAEFLFWVPKADTYATYFLCNPTGHRASSQFHALLRKAATVRSNLIKGPKHTWHGPQAVVCSTPLDVPNMDDIKHQIEQFHNAKSSVVEVVDEDDRER